MKKWLVLLLLVVGATKVQAQEVYIPLGDSLAAGQTPYRQIDTGYTDLIALKLSQELQFYSKELTFPGYTVANVLQRIEQPDAQSLLSKATLITISAGANDLLQIVQHRPEAGTLTYSQLAADFSLNQVRQKVDVLLQKLKDVAPNAEIYVMGYYFPYPNVHETQKVGTAQQLDLLNDILQQQAEAHGAYFIAVEQNFNQYLPNYADVHPTMEGYLVMANAFLAQYSGKLLNKAMLPEPNPIGFEQLLQMNESNKDLVEDLRMSPY
ncbi:SGNH/GDSL hydrolase family protein [Metasolibacillus meyeri]|uniref:SGNH/GDSL hydrolase family protein n=1 Tax=Metasolibacillus meyeri TaxID=1071052 RepID=UPI000D301B00|nr:SGNH/GDSL hydrolase family protein [Metasolibacillus meyeri]